MTRTASSKDLANRTGRRRFIAGVGAGAGALAVASTLPAAPALADGERRLRLHNVHTGDRFDDVYHDGSDYAPDALEALDWLTRDFRESVSVAMDPGVYDLMWALTRRYMIARGHLVTLSVLSGFRTEATNEALRSEGAALNSYHKEGMAVDVAVQGYGIHILANQAQRIGAGGLGIYWRGQFVHMDTGPARFWYRR